jgi:uncharacterized protein YdcH (DUF465 family)
VVATGVPVGWGEPVYDRLDADIAYAMMGINAVKGVEIGAGFASVAQLGTQHNDEMTRRASCQQRRWRGRRHFVGPGRARQHRHQAHGQHPPRPALHQQGRRGGGQNTHGRHDPCVGIRATPIAEAMLALVLMDHALRHRAQNADVACATPKLPGWRRAVCSASRRRSARIDRRQLCAHRGRRVNPTRHTRLTIDREVAHGATRSSPRIPQYRDQIHALKVSNGHFARLFDEYHDVNRHVVRVEVNAELATDFELEDLKKRRLRLKDDSTKC